MTIFYCLLKATNFSCQALQPEAGIKITFCIVLQRGKIDMYCSEL